MKTISGDLIRLAQAGQFDLIAHGCNCFCTMGAGIAKTVKAVFPAAFQADEATQRGDRAKLGTCSFAEMALGTSSLVVVNAYTQFDWRGRGPQVDYAAVRSCMEWIKKRYPGRRMGLPKIGAGLAGGDWPTIVAIPSGITFCEFQKPNWQKNEGRRMKLFFCLHSPANNHKT